MEQLYQSRYTGPEIDRRLGLMAGNFLWIKWSAAYPVIEMLDTPGPYIGIYTGEADTPPEDPDEYKWYLNKGDTGTGLDILGTYATLSALQAAVSSPTQGDMYNVGEAAPYHVYMWDTTEPPSAWKDQGILQGPPGQDGAPGPNEITTATATPLSGVLVGKDGYVKEGVAGEDYVPPISGAAAGLAVFTATNGMQEAKSAAEARTAIGAVNGIWPILTGGSGMSGTAGAVAANLNPAIVDVNATRGVKWGNVVVLELAIHMAIEATMPAANTPLVRLAEGYRPEASVYVAAMSEGSITTEFGIDSDGNISSQLVLVAGRWYVGTVTFLLA